MVVPQTEVATVNASPYPVNGERLWQTLHSLAEIGATAAGGVARVALTDEDRAGRDQFVTWVRELGCTVHIDQMGNLFARREGSDPRRAPVVIGSHLDSQPTGGRYDGAYGVMVGLEVLRVLHDNEVITAAPVEVVSWTNEEGARFPPAMIGSGVYAGAFSLDDGLAAPGVDGTTLGGELARIGYAGTEPCGEPASTEPCGEPDSAGRRPIGHYIEPHIEQGPILEAAEVTLGAVTGVQGIRWYDVTIEGQSAHAGSTPMGHRADAMVAAARLVCEADEIAARRAPEGRATVGTLSVGTGSRNTVAGSVSLTVDLRHPDAAELEAMHDELLAFADGPAFGPQHSAASSGVGQHSTATSGVGQHSAASSGVGQHSAATSGVRQHSWRSLPRPQITPIWYSPPIVFDPAVVDAVRQGAVAAGFEPVDITSGAGHDACYVSMVAPTGMLFIPCADGLSHNEAESILPEHATAGAQATLNAVLALAS
ncbi:Zn-dependent hydrolase [Candidatus Poriferisodalis sp.]|uniref:Zn-dependent hydrolase n=1 Tax=Candidatus Poriferisodalis sp. TaxID=3101277 RepID=UPI003B51F24E